ncbi:hypothetical protein J2T61_002021 [Methanocalculus sp. AMF5]|uniref:hypothetical protein n=1 Tax=Methanocalculus sp. AMF5 TaxID=1198257 RepID=UPI00209DB61C|nr:hypothetical protein [Methanocalculus sp. AMF5]MCP1663313.1 hypothetical protein [Methanocalculus sp. AMF5]
MKDKIEYFILITGIAVVLLIIIHATTAVYYEPVYKTKLINHAPAGEITQDFFLEQVIPIPLGVDNTNVFILHILIATYKRNNDNNILFRLTQNDMSNEIVVNTKDFKDNSFITLKFNSTGFIEGSAILTINGLDGQPGNAVTVWVTEDISNGQAVINGEETNRSLMMIHSKIVDNPYYTIDGRGIVFFIWCLTYIMIIVGFFFYCKEQQ